MHRFPNPARILRLYALISAGSALLLLSKPHDQAIAALPAG